MNVSKIAAPAINTVREGFSKVGKKLLTSDKLQKINKFVEPSGFSMAHGAFITAVCSCVMIPRLIKARDKDEKREIFTRDLITIAVMLLAMKAIRGGLADMMGRKTGLNLTQNLSKDQAAKGIKRLGQYINPMGGIDTLSRQQIESVYSKIDTKDSLVKFLENLKNKGGDSAKALKTIIQKGEAEGLMESGKKLFGENLDKMDNVVEIVKNADNATLSPILKVLNNANNPLVKTAKSVNAWLQAGALGVVVSFLGFGLPAINKKITEAVHKKDAQKEGQASQVQTQPQQTQNTQTQVSQVQAQNPVQTQDQVQNTQTQAPVQKNEAGEPYVIVAPIKMTQKEYEAFKKFIN